MWTICLGFEPVTTRVPGPVYCAPGGTHSGSKLDQSKKQLLKCLVASIRPWRNHRHCCISDLLQSPAGKQTGSGEGEPIARQRHVSRRSPLAIRQPRRTIETSPSSLFGAGNTIGLWGNKMYRTAGTNTSSGIMLRRVGGLNKSVLALWGLNI